MRGAPIVAFFGVVGIGVISAVLLFGADPEYVAVVSADDAVVATGFAHEPGLTLAQVDGAAYGVRGTVYHVTPDGAPQTLPVRLVFANATDPLHVATYDDALHMWEWVEESTASAGYRAIATTQLGYFAVLPRTDVTLPDFLSVYDELRAQAPAHTVGYRIAVGYATDDSPVVRLSAAGEQGGCGGAVQPGETTAYAAVTRSAQILVDDVTTPVTLTFIASWYVAAEGQCKDGESFHAAEGYGILPAYH